MAKEKTLTLHKPAGQLAEIGSFAADMEQYVAQNNTNDFKSEDLITPRIRILQSGSPQVKRSNAEYIDGAGDGMIFNTATKQVLDGGLGITVVPCYFNKEWVEWVPVNQGGGLVKRWNEDESFMNSGDYEEIKGKWINKDGGKTEITKHANYFVLVVDEATGKSYPTIVTFSGTDFKKSRGWNTILGQKDYFIPDRSQSADADGVQPGSFIQPPPFYKVFELSTIPESNDSGEWFGWRVKQKGTIETLKNGKAVWALAADFRKLVSEGKLDVRTEEPQEVVNNATDGSI